jgi:glycine/D-amino acid oxidase-like deaminating enzyme/nitrite reductase/ring-hydroxylating ferredoxin subunit
MNIRDTFSTSPQSYWLSSILSIDYPKLNDSIKTDIAIVGGGIVGILCAYLLSQQGVKVCIFEADRILHGTTAHTTAKITSLHDLRYHKIEKSMSKQFAQQYATANETAIKMIQNIASQHNINCDLKQESSYVYTLEEKYIKQIEAEASIASTLGIESHYLEQTPLPFDIKAAIRFDNQAQFHPLKFLLPLAQIISDSGNQIYERTRIVDLEYSNKIYYLKSSEGFSVTCDKVIIASHYPFYNKTGLYFSRIYPARSYVIAIKTKEKYPGGMYISAEDIHTRSLRSQNDDKGELILIGGEHHKTGQGEDTRIHYKALLDFAKEYFIVQNIPYHWSAQDCMSVDDIPIVGQMTKDTPNLYVATGFGKWGMTNSMASAMLLRDLILNVKNYWQDVYNPSRHSLLASAKTFVTENANVAKEFIKGKLSQTPENINIKKGEGKVIEMNGQRVGAYRDEDGKLYVINITCTHMGCELNWNSAEKSWDCPCHGSRFSYTGNVIEGPACMPLNFDEDTNIVEKLIKDDY